MSEEALSQALFLEASEDPTIYVLSWQAINGKGYFTADVKVRLPGGERMEPDLILASSETVWLIEVKRLHSEALADEYKLARLMTDVPTDSLLAQISRRAQYDVMGLAVAGAVAYATDDLLTGADCLAAITHISWESAQGSGRPLLSQLSPR